MGVLNNYIIFINTRIMASTVCWYLEKVIIYYDYIHYPTLAHLLIYAPTLCFKFTWDINLYLGSFNFWFIEEENDIILNFIKVNIYMI